MEFKKILCAIDFAESNEKIVDCAKSIAKAFKGKIFVIYVAPTFSQFIGLQIPTKTIDDFIEEIVSTANKNMDSFMKESFKDVEAEGNVLRGDPAEVIIEFSKEIGADIIVMGTHGRKGINKLLFGSVAQKVIKHSQIPVLTVKP